MPKPAAEEAPTPRPSASLVIINSRNEILLLQRNPKSSAFAGFHVFPGGNFDSKQDASLQMTALRETMEESGLLLARDKRTGLEISFESEEELMNARNAIHSGKISFEEFLRKRNARPATDHLLPFTQWVTPKTSPKRFRTQFYVVFLTSTTSSGFNSGDFEHRIPTPDGGQEVIAARFMSIDSAFSEFREGKILLMPPQFYILTTLHDILKSPRTTTGERNRVLELSKGPFGSMVINPRPLPLKDPTRSRLILTYEGDETRGGPPGRKHRVNCTTTARGIFTGIELERNFDIFSDFTVESSDHSAKL